jgi:hypothetical protein
MEGRSGKTHNSGDLIHDEPLGVIRASLGKQHVLIEASSQDSEHHVAARLHGSVTNLTGPLSHRICPHDVLGTGFLVFAIPTLEQSYSSISDQKLCKDFSKDLTLCPRVTMEPVKGARYREILVLRAGIRNITYQLVNPGSISCLPGRLTVKNFFGARNGSGRPNEISVI